MYVWHPLNPISVYQRQTRERAPVALLAKCAIALDEIRGLDVGCGSGSFLRTLVSLGARPPRLQGLDLMPCRILAARVLSPAQVGSCVGDAGSLPYPNHNFSIARTSHDLSSAPGSWGSSGTGSPVCPKHIAWPCCRRLADTLLRRVQALSPRRGVLP
jgi:SAM-dependent methyltransferase